MTGRHENRSRIAWAVPTGSAGLSTSIRAVEGKAVNSLRHTAATESESPSIGRNYMLACVSKIEATVGQAYSPITVKKT